ncbi:unnamed protein product [marine sediment metagenome]|uniref:Peptidase M48 domain-containing protein n=1 Tax=marine sediment metagenome TaxID=412755 RepID=X1B6V8_9ZZZZ
MYKGLKNGSLAYSWGLLLFGKYYGRIFISKDIAKNIPNLLEDELDFIIAHELSHILCDHSSVRLISELPDLILNIIPYFNNKIQIFTKIAKVGIDLFNFNTILSGDLPHKEKLRSIQELEADQLAIHLTRNKEAAISCLEKLSNEKLWCGTHFSKVFNCDYPQRIIFRIVIISLLVQLKDLFYYLKNLY